MIKRPKALARRFEQPLKTSLRLNHARIFILPTRRGAFYLLALGLLLLTAINYQNSLAYGLSFWLAGVGWVSVFYTWRNLLMLTLTWRGVENVFCGQSAWLQLGLEGARAHYGIELTSDAGLRRVDVLPQAPCDVRLAITTGGRGAQPIGRIKLSSSYPLGLFTAWSWVTPEHKVLVYPTPQEGPLPYSLASSQQTDDKRAQLVGLEDFQGTRAYQQGDSPSRIHWKSVSKGQGLQSKVFAAHSVIQEQLELPKGAGDIEQKLSLLCYWVLELTKKNQAFSLRLGERTLGPGQGPEYTKSCLEALAHYG